MNTAEYRRFKRIVFVNAEFECEICGSSDTLTVHHLLKQSLFPQYRLDPVNGVALCGLCHAQIERKWRDGEDFTDVLGKRLEQAHEHFGCTWEDLGVDRDEDN